MTAVLQFPTMAATAALRRAISNALNFVEKSRLIPAIAAVRFEVSGSKLEVISTDRYRLFWEPVQLPDEPAVNDFMIEAADAKTVLGLLKGAASATITIDDRKATFEAGLSSAAFETVDATFPQWRSLLPTGDPVAVPVIGLDQHFLADLAKVDTGRKASRAGTHVTRPLRLSLYGAKKPVLITFEVEDDGPVPTLLLMPVGLK